MPERIGILDTPRLASEFFASPDSEQAKTYLIKGDPHQWPDMLIWCGYFPLVEDFPQGVTSFGFTNNKPMPFRMIDSLVNGINLTNTKNMEVFITFGNNKIPGPKDIAYSGKITERHPNAAAIFTFQQGRQMATILKCKTGIEPETGLEQIKHGLVAVKTLYT